MNDSDDFRICRNKAEQFRKARNNYFRRGHEICCKSEAEVLVLIRRKGKFYRFSSSDSILHVSEAEIDANLVMARTPADMPKFVTKEKVAHSLPSQAKKRDVSSPVVAAKQNGLPSPSVSIRVSSPRSFSKGQPTTPPIPFDSQDRQGNTANHGSLAFLAAAAYNGLKRIRNGVQ